MIFSRNYSLVLNFKLHLYISLRRLFKRCNFYFILRNRPIKIASYHNAISSKALPKNLKLFNYTVIVIRREYIHHKRNTIFAPSTLENRHFFTMKIQVYSGIRELTTSFSTGVLRVLDCQLAIKIHIVPREKIAPFQIHSVGLNLIMFSNLNVLYSSL